MAISADQAGALAQAYQSGSPDVQSMVNSMGVTQADVAQYFPGFDVGAAGLSLPSTQVSAPLGGNAVNDAGQTGGALSMGANAPWQGGLNAVDNPASALLSNKDAQGAQMGDVINQLFSGNLTAQLQNTGHGQSQYTLSGLTNPNRDGYGATGLDITPVAGTYKPGETPTVYQVALPANGGGTLNYQFKIDPATGKVIPDADPSTALSYNRGSNFGAGALELASMNPVTAPLAAAYNVANAIKTGHVNTGTVLSGLNAYTGLGGPTGDISASTLGNVKNALSGISAVESKNPLGLVNPILNATGTQVDPTLSAASKLGTALYYATQGNTAGVINTMMSYAKSSDPTVSSAANKIVSDASSGKDVTSDITNFASLVNSFEQAPGYGNTVTTTAGLATDQNPLGTPFTKSAAYEIAYQKLIDQGMSAEDADRLAKITEGADSGSTMPIPSQVEVIGTPSGVSSLKLGENGATTYFYIAQDANGNKYQIQSPVELNNGDSVNSKTLPIGAIQPYSVESPGANPLGTGGGGGGTTRSVGSGAVDANSELSPLTAGQGSPVGGGALSSVANVNVDDGAGVANGVVNPLGSSANNTNAPSGAANPLGSSANNTNVPNVPNGQITDIGVIGGVDKLPPDDGDNIDTINITGSPLGGDTFVPNLTTITPDQTKVEDKQVDHNCGAGYHWDEASQSCVKDIKEESHTCPTGYHWDEASNSCVKDTTTDTHTCPAGYHWDEASNSCVKDATTTVTTPKITTPTTTTTQQIGALSTGSSMDTQSGKIPGTLLGQTIATGPLLHMNQILKELKQLYPQLEHVDPRILSALVSNQSTDRNESPMAAESLSDRVRAEETNNPYERAAASLSNTADLSNLEIPQFKEGGALQAVHHAGGLHVPEFKTGTTGHYVKGRGDGQSDDIPAMLADGEYVFDADTVAALGNGSSDAGAKVLDKMRQNIRKHKRSAPPDKIPPKAKSPLEYLKGK